MTSVNKQQFKITCLKTYRYLWATQYYFNKKLCYYEVLNQVCRSCLTADVGSFAEQTDRQFDVRAARCLLCGSHSIYSPSHSFGPFSSMLLLFSSSSCTPAVVNEFSLNKQSDSPKLRSFQNRILT